MYLIRPSKYYVTGLASAPFLAAPLLFPSSNKYSSYPDPGNPKEVVFKPRRVATFVDYVCSLL
jgi:hypothetical protein